MVATDLMSFISICMNKWGVNVFPLSMVKLKSPKQTHRQWDLWSHLLVWCFHWWHFDSPLFVSIKKGYCLLMEQPSWVSLQCGYLVKSRFGSKLRATKATTSMELCEGINHTFGGKFEVHTGAMVKHQCKNPICFILYYIVIRYYEARNTTSNTAMNQNLRCLLNAKGAGSVFTKTWSQMIDLPELMLAIDFLLNSGP